MDRVVVLLIVAGCYAPSPPEGIECAANLACPTPLICAFGKCVAEPPPCIEIENGAGTLTVPTLDRAPVIDGKLDDWPTCFVTVTQSSAGLVRDLGANGTYVSGRFSLAADAGHLYLAAEVSGVLPLGERPLPDIYKNNAISVYFDGDGSFTGRAYGTDAAQIVVDHANRIQGFRSASGAITVPAVDHAATTDGSTFRIEMAVTPASFGVQRFGTPLGFDIGLVGGDGSIMTSELVWYQACDAPICGCTNGDSAPYCDARQFGTVTIAP